MKTIKILFIGIILLTGVFILWRLKFFSRKIDLSYQGVEDQQKTDPYKDLYKAAKSRKVITIEDIIEKTDLYKAIKEGNITEVEQILASGTPDNLSAFLREAAKFNHLEIVKLLFAKGADINQPGSYGSNAALISATWNDNLEMVKFLVDNNANINNQDVGGSTALMIASWNGNLEMVKFLVDNDANVSLQGWEKRITALMLAASKGNLKIIELLLAKGADINQESPTRGTALIQAALYNLLEAVKLLLARGADIDAQAFGVGTALMMAARMGNAATVELLLANGADITKKNEDGQTAFDLGNDEIKAIIRNFIAQ